MGLPATVAHLEIGLQSALRNAGGCGPGLPLNQNRGATMQNFLKRLWQDEQGQDLTEYALLLVLIALVAAASVKVLGQAISNVMVNAAKF
jgi:Flp pilus assembly pilin Flp